DRITNKMRVPGGIGKIILIVIFMHPGCFKKTPFIICSAQRITLFVQNLYLPHGFFQMQHICTQSGYPGTQSYLFCIWFVMVFMVFIMAILLQLSAPDAS